ncbi:MAG: hypothetical protein WCV80_00660 [Candidatus Paceibacterota bacterium]|jgi:hypothetical protein
MITSKSLYHSNLTLLFSEVGFSAPENDVFNSLYGGDAARGMRFVDDPVIGAKVLTLPQLKMRAVLEGRRLRIEDESQEEPGISRVILESLRINSIFEKNELEAFGFNFDVYYRFNNVIPMKYIFENIFGDKILKKKDLMNFGMQFSLDKGKQGIVDTYFLKITAPLELMVHMNRHFPTKKMPPEKELRAMFVNCYNEIEEVIKDSKW